MATADFLCRLILCISLISLFSEKHVRGDSTHVLPIFDSDSIHGDNARHHHENFIKKIVNRGGEENKEKKKKQAEEQDEEGMQKEIIDNGDKENEEKRREEEEQQQDGDPSVLSSRGKCERDGR